MLIFSKTILQLKSSLKCLRSGGSEGQVGGQDHCLASDEMNKMEQKMNQVLIQGYYTKFFPSDLY